MIGGSRLWEPMRDGLRYVVARCEWSDFAGSGYRYARNAATERVRRFWLRKSAERYAASLNATTHQEPQA